MKRLSVTLLTGFLGAGKTTLLTHVLSQRLVDARKTAVIVNDVSELNVDAALIREHSDHVIELTGGCTCCSLQDDLRAQLRELAESERFSEVWLETSGVAHPMPLIRAFLLPPDDPSSVARWGALKATVAVVDVSRFGRVLSGSERLEEGVAEAARMVDQIELADAIVLNKVDCVTEPQMEQARDQVRRINPDASLFETTRGAVDFEGVSRRSRPRWLRVMEGEEEAGLEHVVYRAWRPFHPERFAAVMSQGWPGVVRSKGFVWLATQMLYSGLWSQAGRAYALEPSGRWWANLERAEWPENPQIRARIAARWREPYGDRRQELAWIGSSGWQPEAIREALDAALLTDEEWALGQLGWRYLPDPMPGLTWQGFWGEDVLSPG